MNSDSEENNIFKTQNIPATSKHEGVSSASSQPQPITEITSNVSIYFQEDDRPSSRFSFRRIQVVSPTNRRSSYAQTDEENITETHHPSLKFSPKILQDLTDDSIIRTAYESVPDKESNESRLHARNMYERTLSQGFANEALFTTPSTLRQYTEKGSREKSTIKNDKKPEKWSMCDDFLAWEVETTEDRLRKVGYDLPKYNDDNIRKRYLEKHVRRSTR